MNPQKHDWRVTGSDHAVKNILQVSDTIAQMCLLRCKLVGVEAVGLGVAVGAVLTVVAVVVVTVVGPFDRYDSTRSAYQFHGT